MDGDKGIVVDEPQSCRIKFYDWMMGLAATHVADGGWPSRACRACPPASMAPGRACRVYAAEAQAAYSLGHGRNGQGGFDGGGGGGA